MRSPPAGVAAGLRAVEPARDTAAAVDRRATGSAAAEWLAHVGWRHVVVLAVLLVFPLVASPFITFQIGAQTLILGLIALSLTFLGGYGGMISLAQMTIAGMAGYAVAILGVNANSEINVDWPWWLVVPCAIVIATANAPSSAGCPCVPRASTRS
jgi:branched-chain amino acid transport system permease protein